MAGIRISGRCYRLGTSTCTIYGTFAERSLGDLAVLGKSVVKSYYGVVPKYSYWSGCSNGGKQGYVLAQRYPEAFDGIAAGAPGLYWDEQVENFWAQALMQESSEYPWSGVDKAAVKACDTMDGVEDGILGVSDKCTFDPKSLIGTTIDCPDARRQVQISETAAQIVDGVWRNKRPSGIDFQSVAAGYDVDLRYARSTNCSTRKCTGSPDPLTVNWIRIFVKKDMTWDSTNVARKELERLRRQSVREY